MILTCTHSSISSTTSSASLSSTSSASIGVDTFGQGGQKSDWVSLTSFGVTVAGLFLSILIAQTLLRRWNGEFAWAPAPWWKIWARRPPPPPAPTAAEIGAAAAAAWWAEYDARVAAAAPPPPPPPPSRPPPPQQQQEEEEEELQPQQTSGKLKLSLPNPSFEHREDACG